MCGYPRGVFRRRRVHSNVIESCIKAIQGDSRVALPILGEVIAIDGLTYREVTFCAWADESKRLRPFLVESSCFPLMGDQFSDFILSESLGGGAYAATFLVPAGYVGAYRINHVPDSLASFPEDVKDRISLFSSAVADPHNCTRVGVDPVWSVLAVPGVGSSRPPCFGVEAGIPVLEGAIDVDGCVRPVWQFTVGHSDDTFVMLDGDAWLNYQFPQICAKSGPAGRYLLVSSMTAEARRRDMFDSERLLDIVNSALRWANADRPVVVGQSWGGCGALILAIEYPEFVRGAVVQSPSLFFDPRAVSQRVSEEGPILQSIREKMKHRVVPPRHAPIRLSYGHNERDVRDHSESLMSLLSDGNWKFSGECYPGGHHYSSWTHQVFKDIEILKELENE